MKYSLELNLQKKELYFKDGKQKKQISYIKINEKQTFDFFALAIYKHINKDSDFINTGELANISSWNMATTSIGKLFSKKINTNDPLYTNYITYKHKTNGWKIDGSHVHLINPPDSDALSDYLEEIKTHDSFESLAWITAIMSVLHHSHSGDNSIAFKELESIQHQSFYKKFNTVEKSITGYFKIIFGMKVNLDNQESYQKYYKQHLSLSTTPLITSIKSRITGYFQYYNIFHHEYVLTKTSLNHSIYKTNNAIDVSEKSRLLNYRALLHIRSGNHELTVQDAKSSASYALIDQNFCLLKNCFCNISIGYLNIAEKKKECPGEHIKQYLQLATGISKRYNLCKDSIQETLCLASYEMYHCNFTKMGKHLKSASKQIEGKAYLYETGLYYSIKAKCILIENIYTLSSSKEINQDSFKEAAHDFLLSAKYFKQQGKIKRAEVCEKSARSLKNAILPKAFIEPWMVKLVNPNLRNITYK